MKIKTDEASYCLICSFGSGHWPLWQNLDRIDFHVIIDIAGRSNEAYIGICSRRNNTIQINCNSCRVIQLRRRDIPLVGLFRNLRVGQDIKVHIRICIGNVISPIKDRIPSRSVAYFHDDPIQKYTTTRGTFIVNQIPTRMPIDNQINSQGQCAT